MDSLLDILVDYKMNRLGILNSTSRAHHPPLLAFPNEKPKLKATPLHCPISLPLPLTLRTDGDEAPAFWKRDIHAHVTPHPTNRTH